MKLHKGFELHTHTHIYIQWNISIYMSIKIVGYYVCM